MYIHCTKKLMDKLKIDVEPIEPIDTNIDALFSWRANLFVVNRKNVLVLVCDQNRFVVAIHGLKAKDFRQLNNCILTAIQNTLLSLRVNPSVIEKYLSAAGEIILVKNSGAKYTALLNQACQYISDLINDEVDLDYSDTIGVRANRMLVGGKGIDYFVPKEAMLEDLKRFDVEPIIQYPALELTIQLELLQDSPIRKVIVPANITFLQLHEVLQAAFDWEDAHLFTFELFKRKTQKNANFTIMLMGLFGENVQFADKTMLADFIPTYPFMQYHYDFGDDWIHHIQVTNIVGDYTGQAPLLLEGTGDAPPEDVGGPPGYASYLEVMQDPTHPEHEAIKEWVGEHTVFDFEKVSNQVAELSQQWD